MPKKESWDILIIGGGLAGLTTALHLSRHGVRVLLIEKHKYPHHRVCGEYISNEVLPYLKSLGINPFDFNAKRITQFEISNVKGKTINSTLPLGGFGLSRYAFDAILYDTVKEENEVVFDTVTSVEFVDNKFNVSTQSKEVYQASYIVGAFGKRSNIDISLKRSFVQKTSPWLAVKAHYDYDFPDNKVALHNFNGGYCGLSRTETGAVNACYLATLDSFKSFGKIDLYQREVVSRNPHLREFFSHATPLFKAPLTISQISFQQKQAVENHIFMVGDSAGLIHPLCGNGMAMAIHSAKLFSELFIEHFKHGNHQRELLEQRYETQWKNTFSNRLKTGSRIQRLLLKRSTTSLGFGFAKLFPSILPHLIKKTHGEPMV